MSFHPNLDPELAASLAGLDAPFEELSDRPYADLPAAREPWLVEPERISVKVDLWYGGADTSTVHSPDFGATLAARLPNASLTVEPQEGGSLLWTRARDILEWLKSHVSGSTGAGR